MGKGRSPITVFETLWDLILGPWSPGSSPLGSFPVPDCPEPFYPRAFAHTAPHLGVTSVLTGHIRNLPLILSASAQMTLPSFLSLSCFSLSTDHNVQ